MTTLLKIRLVIAELAGLAAIVAAVLAVFRRQPDWVTACNTLAILCIIDAELMRRRLDEWGVRR